MNKVFKLLFAVLLLAAVQTQAQTNLSVQGTVQEFDGSAVDNGNYDITFKLYEVETGGTAVWSETQSVRVTGGVYSVLLGEVTPLTAAFNTTYFLGITLPGGPELFPRSRLTSSPYALSLIGQDNIFPSTGAVGAGTASPTAGYQLHAKNAAGDGKVLVEGSANAKVELQSTDGSEIEFKKGANSASITYDGSNINIENLNLVFSNGLSLPAGQTVNYNGIADWRLIDFDDFEATTEGWIHYVNINANANSAPATLLAFNGGVNTGNACGIADNQSGYSALKKQIDLTGIPHTMIKVKMTVHATGSVDGHYLQGGFAPTLTSPPDDHEWGYFKNFQWGQGIQGIAFNPYSARNAFLFDHVELTASHTGNSVVVVMAAGMDENTNNESFVIDNVEVWVR